MSFDLEKTIAGWKQPYLHDAAFTPEDVEELENSLRDRIDDLIQEGLPAREAFARAAARIGSLETTGNEYKKVYWGKARRERRLKDALGVKMAMFSNYLNVARRSLSKQKGYAAINIIGLTVGLASFILIGLYVQFELSFDRFHENADRIYRIEEENPGGFYLGNNQFAVTPSPLTGVLMQEFPDVESAVQIDDARSLISSGDKHFYEDGLFATEHFFAVFDFQLLQGDPKAALSSPNTIILTQSLAAKYFGENEAIGNILSVTHLDQHSSERQELIVTGIIRDVPAASHFHFDYVVPFESSPALARNMEDWGTSTSYTFVLLGSKAALPRFTSMLAQAYSRYNADAAQNGAGVPQTSVYYPTPLTDIHLHSRANFQLGIQSDIRYIYLLSGLAVLILLIACINYINLTTARSSMRTIEAGVRKAMGARRGQLIGQFVSEAVVPSFIALVAALILVAFLIPAFSKLANREIHLSFQEHALLIGFLAFAGLLAGLFAGSVPSFMLSGSHPVQMMKGQLQRTIRKFNLRDTLVVTQFAIATVLVLSAFVIQKQLHYIQNAKLGVDRDQILSIDIKDRSLQDQYSALKQALENHPNVMDVTASATDPTLIEFRAFTEEWEGAEEGQSVSSFFNPVQHGFVDLLDIQLVEGRDFSESMSTDAEQAFLINETFKKNLGLDTAIGKRLRLAGRGGRVIGVIEDFNFLPAHHEMAPLTLFLDPGRFSRVLVKIRPGNTQETVDHLHTTMTAFSPEYPFIYHFLDDAYNDLYQTEIRFGRLLNYFTMLSLFIACLGLFGLAAFTAQQRTKEIGVRKVLGATVSDILLMLSKDYSRLVLLAFVLGAPIGYLVINRWLNEFAFKITVGWSTFAIAGGVLLIVAWLAVSVQSMRAALADPVKSIRYE